MIRRIAFLAGLVLFSSMASAQYFENLFYNGVRRLRPRLGGALGTYFRYVGPVYLQGAAPPANPPDARVGRLIR